MSWKSRVQIAADIAEGMAFLHSRKPPLIHRDLKSQNVLLRSDGRAKIADFGLSKFCLQVQQNARHTTEGRTAGNSMDSMSTDMTGATGTVKWMAPEVQTNPNNRDILTSKYGLAADVYSYGIVLFELVTSRTPWDEFGPFRSQIERAVQAGKRPEVTEEEKGAARANDAKVLLDWMLLCWAQNPKDRPTFKAALRACRQIESVSKMYQEDSVGEGRRRGTIDSIDSTRLSISPLAGFEGSINGGRRYLPPAFHGGEERSRETEILSSSSSSGVGGGGERKRGSFDMDINNMSSGRKES